MLKMSVSYLALFLPCISFVLGLLIALDPYLFVPMHVVQRFSIWGDPSKQPGLVIFSIKSRGTFTANYPVDVEVEVRVGKDIEGYFQGSSKIEVFIPDSYQYPIVQSPEGFFHAGKISISVESRKGKGTITFPYPGYFSTYHIYVNDRPVWTANFPAQNEPSIFTIENYGVRSQIENTNRNVGIAIMSLSIAIIGLILKIL